jgi:hypothetical protein
MSYELCDIQSASSITVHAAQKDTNTKGPTLLGMPSTPSPAMLSARVVWASGPAAAAMAVAIEMLLWERFLALVLLTDLPALDEGPLLA